MIACMSIIIMHACKQINNNYKYRWILMLGSGGPWSRYAPVHAHAHIPWCTHRLTARLTSIASSSFVRCIYRWCVVKCHWMLQDCKRTLRVNMVIVTAQQTIGTAISTLIQGSGCRKIREECILTNGSVNVCRILKALIVILLALATVSEVFTVYQFTVCPVLIHLICILLHRLKSSIHPWD